MWEDLNAKVMRRASDKMPSFCSNMIYFGPKIEKSENAEKLTASSESVIVPEILLNDNYDTIA